MGARYSQAKHSQEAMADYFKVMRSRAKCIDVIENDDTVLVPVQNLPINNHAQIAHHLDSVIAGGFDITKVCMMDQSASRIAEIWHSYKEEICLSGPDASKLKCIITAMDKLMMRLLNSEGMVFRATEFHEKIKSKGSITQYIMVAVLPSRRSQGLFTFCYHYVEAEKGTTPEQLTAYLINNTTIGYDQKDQAWRYIMEGAVDDLPKRAQSRAGGKGRSSFPRKTFKAEPSIIDTSMVHPMGAELSMQDEQNFPKGSCDLFSSRRPASCAWGCNPQAEPSMVLQSEAELSRPDDQNSQKVNVK